MNKCKDKFIEWPVLYFDKYFNKIAVIDTKNITASTFHKSLANC